MTDYGDMVWLADLVDARDESGRPRYAVREIEDFLATLLLSQGFEARALPPNLQDLMSTFADRAGILPEATSAEAERAIAAYLEAHPPSPHLVSAFRLQYREMLTDLDTEALSRGWARLVSHGDERTWVDPNAPPPEGAVAGGPLGFFRAHEKTGKGTKRGSRRRRRS